MKLLEVAPDFVKGEAGTLMTILQSLESKTAAGTVVPLANISKLMNNVGYTFNYELLKDLISRNKSLKDMVSDYNENSITLGHKEVDTDTSLDDGDPAAAKTVDQMASKASKF